MKGSANTSVTISEFLVTPSVSRAICGGDVLMVTPVPRYLLCVRVYSPCILVSRCIHVIVCYMVCSLSVLAIFVIF